MRIDLQDSLNISYKLVGLSDDAGQEIKDDFMESK